MRSISIRSAMTGEWELIFRILDQSGLTARDIDPFRTTFHVAVAHNMVVGCAGTERHGNVAVVWPVAVLPECRGRGIASRLVQSALMRARVSGCLQAVFLSRTCASYFSRHGFLLSPRSALPDEVRASTAFLRQDGLPTLCMTRVLS